MRTNQLARRRGIRAVTGWGVIAGAAGVAALAGTHAASAAAPQVLSGVVVLAETDTAGTAAVDGDGPTKASEETTPPPVEPTPGEEPTVPTVPPEEPGTPGDGGGDIPGSGGPAENPATIPPVGSGGGGNGGDGGDGGSSGDGDSSGDGGSSEGGGSSSGGGGGLPATGSNTIGLAGVGAAIAAGGVGLVILTRRRRVEPEA